MLLAHPRVSTQTSTLNQASHTQPRHTQNMALSHGLQPHRASRRFVSKAACFARLKLPGANFEHYHMADQKETRILHAQVTVILCWGGF